jgi:hypothetical protein
VVCRGQPEIATAGVKALFLTQSRKAAKPQRSQEFFGFYNFAPWRLDVK